MLGRVITSPHLATSMSTSNAPRGNVQETNEADCLTATSDHTGRVKYTGR